MVNVNSDNSTTYSGESGRKNTGKTAAIVLACAGLLLLLLGTGIKLYEKFSNSSFYINDIFNSFCGAPDVSIVTGTILLIGTGVICLLGKVQNKKIRVISRILVTIVFLSGLIIFLGMNSMTAMWTELQELSAPDGKRMAVVCISGFMDDRDYDVYIKTNPAFVQKVSNEEQKELHYFVEPYTKILWYDSGFTIDNSGSEPYTYLYPAE